MTAEDDGAPAAHESVVLRVPYPRWRRWARSLRRRSGGVRAATSGADPHERVYLGYGLVLVGIVYAPLVWRGIAVAAGALSGPGVVAVGLVVAALAGALALVVARAGGPVWVSAPEATFVLAGQFPPAVVLRRRALLLVAVLGVLGAFAGSALAAGAQGLLDVAAVQGSSASLVAPGPTPGAVAACAGWAVAAAFAAQVPLALGVGSQTTRWSAPARAGVAVWVAAGLTWAAVLLVTGSPGGLQAWAPGCVDGACTTTAGPDALVLAVLVVLGGGAALLVVRVLLAEVDVDRAALALRRSQAAGSALAGGQAVGLSQVWRTSRAAERSGSLAGVLPGLLLVAPLAARDLLGLRRRPRAALGSLVVGLAGALVVALPGPGGTVVPVAATLGAALLYAASATWADGLAQVGGQRVPGGLLPGGPARWVGGHLVVPAVLAAVLGTAATAVGYLVEAGEPGTVGTPGGGDPVVLGAALVLVLATRGWVAGASTVPPGLFTPMSTPNGDASMLLIGAWYVRGWIVVLGAAWLLGVAGPRAVPVLLVAAAVLVVAAVRRFDRE